MGSQEKEDEKPDSKPTPKPQIRLLTKLNSETRKSDRNAQGSSTTQKRGSTADRKNKGDGKYHEIGTSQR